MNENGGSDYEHVIHTFPPVFDERSEILVLGSFPSVKSREQQFYYGHPQNRFWKVISAVFESDVPVTIEEKKQFLLEHRIAVWDVIESCDIIGSSDSSIKNVVGNDMSVILDRSRVRRIFANGEKAYRLFLKYCNVKEGLKIRKLPSTSPANAAWNLQRLTETWKKEIKEQELF